MDKTQIFIKKARNIHGDKYDYSQVIYTYNKEKVKIICPLHGEFFQTPSNHIHKTKPQGCRLCGIDKLRQDKKMSLEDFIAKANKIHNNKYDYSETAYGLNSKVPVTIICPIHGKFYPTPNNHIHPTCPTGCPKCKLITIGFKTSLKLEGFINKSRNIHGNKFNYDKVIYKNTTIPVIIICPIHGEFSQTPAVHFNSSYSCPACFKETIRSLGERSLFNFIENNGFVPVANKRPLWLKTKQSLASMELDIYIPELNLAIEYNGCRFHNNALKNNDYHLNKYRICLENNVNLIHIFDLEDINKWKRKLKLYFENSEKYEISFKNNRRTFTKSSSKFVCYGQSYIKVKNVQ